MMLKNFLFVLDVCLLYAGWGYLSYGAYTDHPALAILGAVLVMQWWQKK
jgi:hypothetical protein